MNLNWWRTSDSAVRCIVYPGRQKYEECTKNKLHIALVPLRHDLS